MLNKNRRLSLLLMLVMIIGVMSISLDKTPATAATKTLIYAGVQSKGDIPTLDPALVEDTASSQVVNEMFFPIVRGDEVDLSKLNPGIASKWSLSKDGLTLTFTLRPNISWVMWDGKQVVQVKDASGKPMMVTAQDYEYGVKRMLDPRTASPYALIVGGVIKGANEFTSSKATGADLDKLRDAVGVKATDATTLVVTLPEPLGYAINVLTLPNFAPMPQAMIDKFADKWTEPGNMASYGPYVLSEWKHDESVTLIKNPFWKGIENAPAPKIDQVVIPFLDQTPSLNNYEAGSADVDDDVTPGELDRIKADAKLKKELVIGPSACTYYYGFASSKAPVDDPHFRRALSLSVDRQSIVDNVSKGGQVPARWFVRPGMAAAPTLENSPKLGIGYDPETAKKELQMYLDAKKITVDQIPPIGLVVNQVEAHVKIAEAIQQMWQDTLGIKVEITSQEWKVTLASFKTDPPQVFRLGWCADYADATNFDREVFRSDSPQNYGKYNNPEFDKIVDQAARETNPAKRLELYRQAEDILVNKDAGVIPIYWYTSVTLTKSYVNRTHATKSGDNRLEKWDITK